MVSYQEWNERIYKYFFNEISIQDTIFFCVDSELISYIGKNLNISNNIEDEFCKSVLFQLLEKNSKGCYILSPQKYKLKKESNAEIPYQTAMIAFFIYVGSKMGENPKYRANAYWPLFDSITEKYYEPYDKTRQSSCYESLFGLFNDFKNYINNKYNIDFNFPNLFNRADKRDFIGLPIFQSMISAKDRCILTQKFYEYKNKYSTLLDYCPQIAEGSNYSNVFKKIRDNSEYNKYLIDRVKSIAQSWDGCVYEYDNIKSERQRTIIPIIYQYKIDINGNLKFYLTTNNLNKFDISFKNFKLNLNNPRESLSNKDISINEISYPILNTKMKIARTKSDYILFKKDAVTNLYTEVSGNNKIVVGDIFSIIAPIDFFNHTDNIDSLERVISGYDEQSSCSINNDLCLLHNAVAGNYDNKFVYIDKKNKITFSKGLKACNHSAYSYVKGAEPLITVNDMITVDIDEKKYYIETAQEKGNGVYKKTFDIRKMHNEYGNHSIRLENSRDLKSYKVVPISSMPKLNINSEKIYNIIDNNKLRKSKSHDIYAKSVVGACLENINEDINCNDKIVYILKILEQHKNKEKFPMPEKLKIAVSEILSEIPEINVYIKNNLYIDNYMYAYLKELKEV